MNRTMIHMLLPALFLILWLHPSAASLIVKVPGRCPQVCSREISSVFNACMTAKWKGCTMAFCPDPSGKPAVQCALKPGVPDLLYTGETIVFKGATVGRPYTLNIPISKGPAKTDVYFLADATGSMSGILASIKQNFLKLAAEVGLMSDAAFGVGIFRDERELVNGFRNVQPITKSLDTARAALSKFTPKGGLDTPEGNLAALLRLANSPGAIGWRPGARRVVLYIGDNPGHEPSCVSGVDGAITRARVIGALTSQKIAVIALTFTFPGLDGSPLQLGCGAKAVAPGGGQATAIARATGGTVIKGVDSKFNVQAVVQAMKMLKKEVSVGYSSCGDKVGRAFTPALPAFVDGGSSLQLTVTARGALCSGEKYYSCTVALKDSGVVLPRIEVKFNFLKCPKAA